ncbi:alkaline phosphatase [Glaesserella sp.]|uniref:alkaline phosphatase n=1 Tax=Glaesserella sp. TaxID=2094731 RepID=UPI00359FEFE8
MKKMMKVTLAILVGVAVGQNAIASDDTANAGKTKNVILLISDGASPNTWKAASYFRHGALGKEVYDSFDVKVFASTYPLNTSKTPTNTLEGSVVFDASKLWNDGKSDASFKSNLTSYSGYFDGYDYARTDFTDSAAAATALASGQKTYNSAVNWSNNNTPLKNIGEYVVENGKALGVVTSVQWSHATPAGFLSHNIERNNYAEIAKEAVESGRASVIMGAGHPYYDKNGKRIKPEDDKAFRYVGGPEIWDKLSAGETDYMLIDEKEDFIALAEGKLNLKGKSKLLGTAQNNATLQFNRAGVTSGNLLENQPALATMAQGALNILSQNPNGFFLMVEGGAVDWAAHANNLPRLIEEQIDFNLTVEAVVDWVNKNSSWNDTLVIVTTDHGNGLLLGPDSNSNFYSEIVNQGAGALPLVRWHFDNHTRELVPLFAKGNGADYFLSVAKEEANIGRYYNVEPASQRYVDNTDVFRAAMNAFGFKEDKK